MSERFDMPIGLAAPSGEESPRSAGPENRAQTRFPFTAAANVCELQSQTRVAGRCSDLSSGGCYIDTISPLTVGTAVRVRIERDQSTFEAGAVVAYAHVSMGMGLAFTKINPGHQDILRTWIAELSGGQPTQLAAPKAKPETGAVEANATTRLVLHELITMLVSKKILTENEGEEFLRQMFR
jgi:hypothetical protein